VAAGSIAWWFTITTIVGLFHKNINDRVMKWINHAMGVAITLFGLAVIGNLIRAQLA
jgi:arginine exporter protein ArgO